MRKPRLRISILLIVLLLPSFICAEEPPVLPLIDKPMRAQLRNLYNLGLAEGNHPDIFAKVGDSITRGKYFLKSVGCNIEVLASYQSLAPTIDFFRQTSFPDSYTTVWCGKANTFSRDSVTADNGWTAAEPLTTFANPIRACPAPDDNPLRCEFRILKPSIALIMFGTNDLEEDDPAKFRKNLIQVVQETMVLGVVPVLSTIPPRLDDPSMGRRVAPYNKIIREIADTLQVPLWNYWLVLQGPHMINQGMDTKGIHPSVYNHEDSVVFTAEALRYGFNQRNLNAIQVLKKVKSQVQDKKRSDSTSLSNYTIYPTQLAATVLAGATVDIPLRIFRINLTDPIKLRLKAPPEGISGQFQIDPTYSSAILTVNVASDVPTGSYRITVKGKTGRIKRTTTFALEVTN